MRGFCTAGAVHTSDTSGHECTASIPRTSWRRARRALSSIPRVTRDTALGGVNTSRLERRGSSFCGPISAP